MEEGGSSLRTDKMEEFTLTLQTLSETDPAGTLEKPCSGTFRTQSTTLRESRLRRDWTSLLVNSCITCSMSIPPGAGHYKALEVFPAGLLNATPGLIDRASCPGAVESGRPTPGGTTYRILLGFMRIPHLASPASSPDVTSGNTGRTSTGRG